MVECEQILQNAAAYETSIIRFGGLIGPEDIPFITVKRTQIDNPEGKINFIHLDDCIELIKRCINTFKAEVFIMGCRPITQLA